MPGNLRSKSLLILVGNGSERNLLARRTVSLNIDDTVLFTGPQSDVLDYYWASDLFVLPSRTEGFSNALIEAMACGLPVVASDVGDARKLVDEGKSGFLVESDNYDQLAQSIGSLLKNQRQWPALGDQARTCVIGYADIDQTVKRLERLYCQSL